jgi:anti-anti-sigma factor
MTTTMSVEALGPGDHACLTFSDAEERLDIVAAFVGDGLAGGDRVMCFTDAVPPHGLRAELAARGVLDGIEQRDGQLTLHGIEETWLTGDAFVAGRMIDMLAEQLDQASREGYTGLRLTADMCWAVRPVAPVDQLTVFESEVGRLFADGRLMAICQYDRQSFDAVTLAFAAAAHPKSVAATVYHEDPLLRVCRQHRPPGIRLAGEIDFTRADVLTQALSETLRLDRHVWVNLSQLRFMDAAAAARIVHAALSLPADRTMTVVCAGTVRKVLRLAGADEVPGLKLLMPHGQS